MELTDVRRLTGVNFLMDRCGAAAEAAIADEHVGIAVGLWRRHMRHLLDAVGWPDEEIHARGYPGGASLAISAPLDALYTATDMIEATWEAVVADIGGTGTADLDAMAKEFAQNISDEANPQLLALAQAADDHGVTFLGNDDGVSLGLGTGCAHWPDAELPDPAEISWQGIHDVPVAMVTGTNGKSTTVRLAAAIGGAAGHCVGSSSSDWVRAGDKVIDEGDYSGPAGARLAVRHEDVDLGIIEAARGGLMRRGLPLPRADVCLITNVAADHLGDYGITSVDALADAKFLLSRAVKPGGILVLNADDPELVIRSARVPHTIAWYGLSPDQHVLKVWINNGGQAAFIQDGIMTLAKEGQLHPILPVADFPPAMGGAAKFNVSNALGAIALAAALNLPVSSMRDGLAGFKNTPDENPGRGNFLDIGGVNILIDFAHNPHGVAALCDAVKEVPAARRLVLLGQAGDRGDDDIREMTRVVWASAPDRVIVKELETKLRGRKAGEVPAVIADELRALGAPETAFGMANSEMASVYQALEWAQPGDFLVLLLHTHRKQTLELLDNLTTTGWHAGQPVLD